MSIEFVTVGKLGRTRGVQGELYIIPETDFPDRFLGLTEIYIKSKHGWEITQIDSTRLVSGRPIIKLKNVDSPEDAALFTNREIGVPKDQIVELPDDSFYIFDLVGCRVYDEQNNPVGDISDVEQMPANDVYVIVTDDNKTLQVPAVKQFVKLVDIKNKKIIVSRDGILDD